MSPGTLPASSSQPSREPSRSLPISGFREFFLYLIRRRQRRRVVGDSMTPTLHPGDEVFLQKRPATTDDVVLCRHPYRNDILILKRVVAMNGGRCELRGDNPKQSSDSRQFGDLPLESIVAVVTSRLP